MSNLLKFISFSMLLAINLYAQSGSYIIQENDQLDISFWESPELNSTSTVSKEGEIQLPIIGKIKAEGLKVEQLRQNIISQMQLYNKIINQLSIDITEFGQNKVWVTGQVKTPDKYTFEEIPNIWEIKKR